MAVEILDDGEIEMPQAVHVARTDRLDIYLMIIPEREPGIHERDQFIAFHRFEDRPRMVGHMMIGLIGDVEWIEIDHKLRRQGYGRELFEAVYKYHDGFINAEGVTPEGIAFCEAVLPEEEDEE
jgi:GNAT superfamily N-acetyltransferase